MEDWRRWPPVGCWHRVFLVSPLTEIHIRDPFILPVEQGHQYYLVASSGRSVAVRQSDARDRHITDGPALYRSKSGKLFMLWSSFSETGYTTGIAISDSGKIVGPWRQQTEPFFREDGGHAMIFRRFDGVLMAALHSPNRSPDERCRLIEVEDTGDTLRSPASVRPKAG